MGEKVQILGTQNFRKLIILTSLGKLAWYSCEDNDFTAVASANVFSASVEAIVRFSTVVCWLLKYPHSWPPLEAGLLRRLARSMAVCRGSWPTFSKVTRAVQSRGVVLVLVLAACVCGSTFALHKQHLFRVMSSVPA